MIFDQIADSETLKLFCVLIGLDESCDQESVVIFFNLLQSLKDRSMNINQPELIVDQRILEEAITESLQNYKKTYVSIFKKEIMFISFKKGNSYYVNVDAVFLRCIHKKMELETKACEIIYNASDVNNDGTMDFSEFTRLVKFVHPAFLASHLSDLDVIFNEFARDDCLKVEQFIELSEKHNLFT